MPFTIKVTIEGNTFEVSADNADEHVRAMFTSFINALSTNAAQLDTITDTLSDQTNRLSEAVQANTPTPPPTPTPETT